MTRRAIAAVGLVGVAATTLPLALRPAPALVWNTTASAPIGLYVARPEPQPALGDWVIVRPPLPLAAELAAAGFLPMGVPLLKRIAAIAPSIVCRAGAVVSVDGRAVATALRRDRFGRPLREWRGCLRLKAGEVLLLNPEPRSLDSRYFGPLPVRLILGRVTPLWVWGEAADAR